MGVRIGCGIVGFVGFIACCFVFGLALFVEHDTGAAVRSGVAALVCVSVCGMAVSK